MNSRAFLISVILLLCVNLSFAQFEYRVLDNVKVERQWKVNFSEAAEQLQIGVLEAEMLAPEVRSTSSAVKAELDAKRQRKFAFLHKNYTQGPNEVAPQIGKSFNGKPLGSAGIPNDNTMAISNGGIIISAINTTVTMLDQDGNNLKYTTLAALTKGSLGLLDRYYDPKVTYDPIADRFILIFLEGSTSADTRIIVGFTQTADPTQDWNFYQINGRPLGGATWSDYPIIAHNKEDLFITVNLLRDNESWQEGFVESFIWQVNKADGYAGDTLGQRLYHDITFNGKAVWSICPVQPTDLEQTEMYFLSVRPGDSANDTVFLHHINNTFSSGKAEYDLKILRSNIKYGVPPSAFQPTVGFRLQTNDTRVLSASMLNDDIHYVQSTLDPDRLSSGIYHAIIRGLDGTPEIKANIISSDSLDYAYPSITYTGLNNPNQHSMMITFSHSGELDFPGTSVLFYNTLGGFDGLYSKVMKVKEGEGLINSFLADSIERWGDYTDIQRKYNSPGTVWLAGSYGDAGNRNNVWIAEVKAAGALQLVNKTLVYPNPATTGVSIAANFDEEADVTIKLIDMKGKVIKELAGQKVYPSATELFINTYGIFSGQYVVVIQKGSGEILLSEKVIVNGFQ